MIKQHLFATFFLMIASNTVGISQEVPQDDSCDDAMTTAQMRECQNNFFQKSDSELNQVYGELMSKLSESRQAKLRESQRAWIQFRDKNAEFMASDFEGGSMSPVISIYWLNLMTKNRISELKESLHELSVE